jgi:hypothetical protein
MHRWPVIDLFVGHTSLDIGMFAGSALAIAWVCGAPTVYGLHFSRIHKKTHSRELLLLPSTYEALRRCDEARIGSRTVNLEVQFRGQTEELDELL